MTGEELWITSDPCPRCGAALAETVDVPDGRQVTRECLSCGWRETWVLDLGGGEQ